MANYWAIAALILREMLLRPSPVLVMHGYTLGVTFAGAGDCLCPQVLVDYWFQSNQAIQGTLKTPCQLGFFPFLLALLMAEVRLQNLALISISVCIEFMKIQWQLKEITRSIDITS
jgi:UDP-2,3-diacylglucosamine pyrophosphatase LpxH